MVKSRPLLEAAGQQHVLADAALSRLALEMLRNVIWGAEPGPDASQLMETILGLILMLILLIAGCCLFFLIFVQPIWGVVDVAISKEHSGGTKAVVILLTLLLLGPIMTFLYACFGTRSRILRVSTLISFVILLLSGGAAIGMALAVPMLQQKLPWRTTPAGNADAGPPGVPAEVAVNGADPETVPSFTAVHLARTGTAQWTAAVAEFDGHGPKPQSALPVVLPSIYPLTHVAVDSQGPVYYGITTHDVGRIIPTTGHFVELKSDPAVSKPSWPAAIAHDSTQGLLLIAARSQGYSYNPKTGEWQALSWLKDNGVVALAYDSGNEVLHGLQTESGGTAATTLLQFNAKGVLLAKIRLSNPIPVGPYPFPLAQLAWADERLICVVTPSSEGTDAGVATACRIYLIEPRSGECLPVRSGTAVATR